MRRAVLFGCAVAVLGIAMVATPATAQDVTINIKNAPPNTNVEVKLTGGGVSESGTAMTSAGGDLSMLLNFGSLGKAEPVEIDTWVEDCDGTATVHLVAAGGEEPECGDETQEGECNCRRVGAFWMNDGTDSVDINWGSGSVSVECDKKKGFLVGAGVDFVSFDKAQGETPSGITRDVSTDDSGTDLSLLAEYSFLPWLALGVSYEALSEIGLQGTLGLVDDPTVQVLSKGEIDPSALELYARLTYWASVRVALHAMVGVAMWETTTTSQETLVENGQEVDSFSSSFDNDGTTLLLGAGIDYWFNCRWGLRFAYKWFDMSKSESSGSGSSNPGVDVEAQAARVLLLFRF